MLIGKIATDITIHDNNSSARFCLGTITDKEGKLVQFHNCVLPKTLISLTDYIKKDSLLYIEGSLENKFNVTIVVVDEIQILN